jgi:hypothetical protein
MCLRLIIGSVIVLGLVTAAKAQVTEAEKKLKEQNADTLKGWKNGGVLAINLAQTSLTNWAAGGEKSLAIGGIVSLFANYKKDKNAWDNSLDIGYGLLRQGKKAAFMKTDDKIDFLSKYGREAYKNFYYAGLINFKTQMQPGFNYTSDTTKVQISDFLAPAYLLGAIGMDYKPSSYFSTFVAPLTSKITMVNNNSLSKAKAFGVDSGKVIKSEFGGYIRLIFSKNDFKNEFLKNVSFTTKIDLFSNYMDNPQNIDINWETLIALKINKFISVNINTQLIYDDNIKIADYHNSNPKPKIQFKEILGLGFSYNF